MERGLEVVNSVLPALNLFFIMGGNYRPDLADRYDPTVPITNIKVREAINRAVDKQEIIDTLFAGNAEPMEVVGWHPSLPGYDPKWATDFRIQVRVRPGEGQGTTGGSRLSRWLHDTTEDLRTGGSAGDDTGVGSPLWIPD